MPDTNHDFHLDTFEHAALPPGPGEPGGSYCHPTAVLEAGVTVGPGTAIWDNVHVRHHTTIGRDCIVGEKTYLAYYVVVGDRCKINSMVYVCTGVTIEDGVMVAAGTVFANDRTPRATGPDLARLSPSEPDARTLKTRVRQGATIGSNCTIGPGVTVGRFAMIGMGAVVTRSVPDFALVVGNPAAVVGVVCRCGEVLLRHAAKRPPRLRHLGCPECRRGYHTLAGAVVEADPARTPPPAGVGRG